MSSDSSLISSSYVRSGNATLSDRYNSKTYAVRGKNATKTMYARDDVRMLSFKFGKQAETEEEETTGRADWDLLFKESTYKPNGKRSLPHPFRVSPTVRRQKETMESQERLTSAKPISIKDIFGE